LTTQFTTQFMTLLPTLPGELRPALRETQPRLRREGPICPRDMPIVGSPKRLRKTGDSPTERRSLP
jgi:hypothetical protein